MPSDDDRGAEVYCGYLIVPAALIGGGPERPWDRFVVARPEKYVGWVACPGEFPCRAWARDWIDAGCPIWNMVLEIADLPEAVRNEMCDLYGIPDDAGAARRQQAAQRRAEAQREATQQRYAEALHKAMAD
jgi:hypothetical protein